MEQAEMVRVAKQLYQSSVTTDAWLKEQEHLRASYINRVAGVISALEALGYTVSRNVSPPIITKVVGAEKPATEPEKPYSKSRRYNWTKPESDTGLTDQ